MLQSSTCEEQRSVVRFLWAKGHKPSEIHRDMRGVYGDDCMDRSNVSRWCTFFQEGRVNLSDSPRSGRPTTAAIPQNVRGIEAAILNDRRVHLFGPMKKFLAGKRFETDVEVKSAVRRRLHSNKTDFYEQGILKLVTRWEKCVEKVGDYVEK
ncbi:hypothetical protein L9F63_010605 [Diploptera punctata]|uniref:Mos1 transposase HTH domain-containing protein n=1 Tax=Diploptera punctata TaxID=6984 RepID=A0AAD8AGF5_DIPPU|nr:hypothetical protein L9F63_010605 [Diploptera punctata]